MNMCRTCLKVSATLYRIFDDTNLPHKIEVISSVKISKEDELPTTICDQCVRNIHLLYDFRSVIIKSNLLLRQRFEIEVAERKETVSVKEDSVKVECDVSEIPDSEQATENSDYKSCHYDCEICKLQCSNYLEYESHKRTHKTPPKSICNICGKSIRSDNLKKHIMIHTEAPVECKVCGKTCKNTESLRGHVLAHKNIKLQCTTCGKEYRHRGAFSRHTKRHLLGDKKTVECTLCSKLFYDARTLKKHIRSHTGERPYPCQYCNKGFSSSNARNTHARQHTNEKPYACQFCSLAFPQKVSLKTHLKSKHPTEVEALQAL